MATEMKDIKLVVRDLSLHYGTFQALASINLGIPSGAATAVIGRTGAGKSQVYSVHFAV